jgi:hypothetical protein
MPEGDVFKEWRVSPGATCNTLHIDKIQDNNPVDSFSITRKAICMKSLPPCPEGTSCEGCETIWCDNEPLPCRE